MHAADLLAMFDNPLTLMTILEAGIWREAGIGREMLVNDFVRVDEKPGYSKDPFNNEISCKK